MKKLRLLNREQIIALRPQMNKWVKNIENDFYISTDPVQFMHAFEDKNDRELAGFFAAIMAWGRRDIVNAKVEDLLSRMDYKPWHYIVHFSDSNAADLNGFKHRTFKPVDIFWLISILRNILKSHDTFEDFWATCYQCSLNENRELISVFHDKFFEFAPNAPARTRKHISNPEKNSSAKRLYMYLRWCLRKNSPVDPGTMSFMHPAYLKIPLDVHVSRVARKLGLLSRKQSDWKAVLELTNKLQLLDPLDPAKYDYALFGIPVFDEKIPSKYILNDWVE